MEFSESFKRFRNEIAEKIDLASEAGMTEDQMKRRAVNIGNWLSREVEPENREEFLLRELWQRCDESEKAAIASALYKIAKDQVPYQ